MQEQAGGRGGGKDAQGLPCWGATLLHHRSEDRSLSAQHMGCMVAPEDALLATGSCPPALGVSPFPLDNLIICAHFSLFLPCRNPAYPSDLSKSSIPAPDGETPRSRAPAGLPAASSQQNMPCATSRHGRLTLSLPFAAFSSPDGVFWAHGDYFFLPAFQWLEGKQQARRALVSPTSPSLSLLFTTQPAHLRILVSDLGSPLFFFPNMSTVLTAEGNDVLLP